MEFTFKAIPDWTNERAGNLVITINANTISVSEPVWKYIRLEQISFSLKTVCAVKKKKSKQTNK